MAATQGTLLGHLALKPTGSLHSQVPWDFNNGREALADYHPQGTARQKEVVKPFCKEAYLFAPVLWPGGRLLDWHTIKASGGSPQRVEAIGSQSLPSPWLPLIVLSQETSILVLDYHYLKLTKKESSFLKPKPLTWLPIIYREFSTSFSTWP